VKGLFLEFKDLGSADLAASWMKWAYE